MRGRAFAYPTNDNLMTKHRRAFVEIGDTAAEAEAGQRQLGFGALQDHGRPGTVDLQIECDRHSILRDDKHGAAMRMPSVQVTLDLDPAPVGDPSNARSGMNGSRG